MTATKPVRDTALPSSISHYTTLEGFQGIVETQSIWASNASFLNDRTELEHALKASKRVISMFSSDKAQKVWSPLIKQVFKELLDGAKPDTYVTCFCKDDDNLSQWRGYSGDLQGINITFNRAKLEDRLKKEKAEFVEVVYSKHSTAAKFRTSLENEIRDIADLGKMIGELSEEERIEELRSRVSALLPRFKHIGFKDEREWRFAIQKTVEQKSLKFRISKHKRLTHNHLF
ncbi:MAG: DUF2971 domain-containing protein [Novosphingobium sp.]